MKNNKFILLVTLIGLPLSGCSFPFFDSNPVPITPDHEHTYDKEWSYDDDFHWHNAICEHKDIARDKEKHSFGPWITDVFPTEDKEGIQYRECEICKYRIDDTIGKVEHSHVPNSPVIENIVEADCINDGGYDLVTYCMSCGEEISRTHEIIPATGHQNITTGIENEVEASCLKDGYYDVVTYCADDNVELDRERIYIPALRHDLVYHQGKDPTCLEDGYQPYRTCSRCDYSTYEVIPATGHQEIATRIDNVVESTCLEAGHYDLITYCLNDSVEISREVITTPALGHDIIYHEGKSATCLEDGYQPYRTCSRCDYSTYQTIPATGHQRINTRIENEVNATCLETGHYEVVTYCVDDKVVLSREEVSVPAYGHNYSRIYHEPTYESKGYYEYTCIRCGHSYTEDSEPQLEHHYSSSWSIDESKGTHYHACTDAGYESLRKDEAAHTYNDEVLPPSFEMQGYTVHTCSVCGHTFNDTYTEVKPHNYSSNWSVDEESGTHYHACIDTGYEHLRKDEEEHVFSVTVIDEPQNYVRGLNEYTCDICDYSYQVATPSIEERSKELLKFELLPNGTYAVVGHNLVEKTPVVIPATYMDIPVTEIGEKAFYNCNYISSVLIPNSIVEIGNYAFHGCYRFTSLEIPNSVTTLGIGCFFNCYNMTNVTLPDNLEVIPDHCFKSCSKLKTISIPNSVTYIGDDAFTGCEALTFTTYSSGNYIGNESNPYLVFIKPTSKTRITITLHSDCKFVHSSACNSNTSLKTVNLPANLIGIGSYAFYGCTSLQSINIPNNVVEISEYSFASCTSLSSLTIGENTLKICERAFKGCSALTEVVIPDKVQIIDYESFLGCSALQTVTIGKGVTYIASHSFCDIYEKSSLTTVYWNAENCGDMIEEHRSPFYLCTKLTTLIIGDTVKYIPSYLFYNKTSGSSISNIEIGNNVENYSPNAFYYCSCTNQTKYEEFPYIGNATNPYVVLFGVMNSDTEILDIHPECKFLQSVVIEWGVIRQVNIPTSVKIISGSFFYYEFEYAEFNYAGTVEEWNAIEKRTNWDWYIKGKVVQCTDGVVVI